MVARFDVYLVNLDTEPSKDAKNTRPCVVISPDEMNSNISNVIIAPLSSAIAKYPTRIEVNFLNSERMIVLDQMRTVDKVRLVKKIGEIENKGQDEILKCLAEIFAE
ncbi:MAG: type II toxin-antitoxin system PemK/MazF family toxin [Pyrinomonadaceae bacterium]